MLVIESEYLIRIHLRVFKVTFQSRRVRLCAYGGTQAGYLVACEAWQSYRHEL